MCNYISSSQIWDKVRESFAFSENIRGTNQMEFNEEYGKILLNHFNTGLGINYLSFSGSFNHDTMIESVSINDMSFLYFNTGNDVLIEDARKNKRVKVDSNICLNGQQQSGHMSKVLYTKGNGNLAHFIVFDPSLFKELIENNSEFLNAKSIYKSDYIDVNFNNFITNHQKLLFNDLSKIAIMEDKLQELYLESKLLDLVYTTLNSIEQPREKENIYLSSKDIESLQKAKDILLENMVNPPSLKELSYKSAINEFKLKKGFKQVYGNTVFGYLQEYRLNEAKTLLESNEINIGEASSLVGYKSISHFSKIFKEHFGFTPIEIKKEQRKIYI